MGIHERARRLADHADEVGAEAAVTLRAVRRSAVAVEVAATIVAGFALALWVERCWR